MSLEPQCVAIPEGWYLMGCERGRDEEKPVHSVWVDAFDLATIQVRNKDYAEFLAATQRPVPPDWNDPHLSDPDQPVVSVSWFDAAAYCEWLSRLSGRRYRLPTEAEWERAARGGVQGALYVWGDDEPLSRADYRRRWTAGVKGPRKVAEEPPNPYGVFDLGENVHEWCADWFDKSYYAVSPERNPQGQASGARRSSRGGSWRHHIKVSRCAARSSIPPEFHYADYGFRVARA
ncbi:MAG: formylglycine-generating enzyme family protein [Bryobacteraceae bacterium]